MPLFTTSISLKSPRIAGSDMSPPSFETVKKPSTDPPDHGILSYLPSTWIPYAELIRLNKPAGAVYLYIPCIYSTTLAILMLETTPTPFQLVKSNLLLMLGSFIFRSAACSWNDILDQEIDRKVSRTRLRPLPRGAISTQSALLYTFVQVSIGLALMSRLPNQCFLYSVPWIVLIGLYPLAKRVTHYPQVVLGLTWSWGAVIGFPVMGLPLDSNPMALKAAGCLYGSGIAWTILYDMIYAHQDIQDDKKAGVKSIAIQYEANAKTVLSLLGIVQVLLLLLAGVVAHLGLAYYLGCASAAATVGVMVRTVNLQSPADCWWWFQYGSVLTGGSVALGVCGEYYFRVW